MKKISIILFVLLTSAYCLKSTENENVFVRNINSNVLDSMQIVTISNVVATRLELESSWEIVTYNDVVSMLEQELDKTLLDCDDESCMQQIAANLGAPYMIAGDITKIGSYYIFNASLLNAINAQAIRKHSIKAKSIDKLLEMVPQMSCKLAGNKSLFTSNKSKKVTVFFKSSSTFYSDQLSESGHVLKYGRERGASVYINDTMVLKNTPNELLLPMGTYVVKMVKDSFHDFVDTFSITKDSMVVLGKLASTKGNLRIDVGMHIERAHWEMTVDNIAPVDTQMMGPIPHCYYFNKFPEGAHTLYFSLPGSKIKKEIPITIMGGKNNVINLSDILLGQSEPILKKIERY